MQKGPLSVLVADINGGPGSSFPMWLAVHDGQLFFSADDGVAGAELWAYDDGASLAADISSGPGPSYPGGYFTVFDYAGGLVTYDGRLFFQAVPSSSPGLWFYDADAGEAELA